MKLILKQEIIIDRNSQDMLLTKSKFDSNKILFCYENFDSFLEIIIHDFNLNKTFYKLYEKVYIQHFYILSDFSIFIHRELDDDDKALLISYTINPNNFEEKHLMGHLSKDFIINLYKITDYEDYFFMYSYEKTSQKSLYYIFDAKNNIILEYLKEEELPYERGTDIISFYTKNQEKFYCNYYQYKNYIYLIDKDNNKSEYSFENYYLYPFAITTTNSLVIAAGEPTTDYSDYVEKNNLINIIIWNKKSKEIIYTYKGILFDNISGGPEKIYYFEKFNCLLMVSGIDYGKISLRDLTKDEEIFTDYFSSLYVDEKNNKFGFYGENTYKIYELLE
ncbi:MAG: hypothetical protein U0457_12585 [Candidatus Sericytochromatia bacterium]